MAKKKLSAKRGWKKALNETMDPREQMEFLKKHPEIAKIVRGKK